MMYEGKVIQGMIRMAFVELRRVGQYGFDSAQDARFGLAFIAGGDLSTLYKSFVANCSFHWVYSPAVGVFTSSGMDFIGNVIYRTVGDGMMIEGSKVKIIRNLVMVLIYEGTYRQNIEKQTWGGLITVNLIKEEDVILQDNVMAGSERIGLKSVGERCDDASATNWRNNVVHSTLTGSMVSRAMRFKAPRVNDGHSSGCTRIRNIFIYMSKYFGMYFNGPKNFVVENSVLVENGLGECLATNQYLISIFIEYFL